MGERGCRPGPLGLAVRVAHASPGCLRVTRVFSSGAATPPGAFLREPPANSRECTTCPAWTRASTSDYARVLSGCSRAAATAPRVARAGLPPGCAVHAECHLLRAPGLLPSDSECLMRTRE